MTLKIVDTILFSCGITNKTFVLSSDMQEIEFATTNSITGD
jgi:hypothetical protein